jgi:hypothetical protein
MLKTVFPSGSIAERWAPWLRKHRREAVDLAALGASLAIVWRVTGDVPASAAFCAFIVAALIPLRPISGPPAPWKEFLAAIPRQVVTVLATGALVRYLLAHSLTCLWFAAVWPVAAWLIRLDYPRIWSWGRRQSWLLKPARQEIIRCLFLLATVLWLMRGFERLNVHRGADALWYGMNLADMVEQVRSGIFPVYVGQSIYQFDGAVSPLRVAPAFHYIGALLDTLTLRGLSTFELLNLLVTLVALAATFSSYLGLVALMPGRRWLAAGLAALFISCPGVLGISYNADLYMSWTTLPFVPLVWFATIRSFQDRGDRGTLMLLGAALGLCWWGHSPIALWSTFFAGAAQVVRLIAEWRRGINWGSLLVGGLTFTAVAAYPLGSVLFFPAEPHAHVELFQEATPNNIVYFLEQVSPDAFLPLSANGRSLSDFQLGFALWAVLIFLLWTQRSSLKPVSAVPLASAVLLALLLIPIPGVDMRIWGLVPGFVRDVTGNWPMSRLYLPMAAATVFGAAAFVSLGLGEPPRRRHVLAVLVAVGCVWSFSEADKFAEGSKEPIIPSDNAVDLLRPENVQLTRYSYGMFTDRPSTFTHGVADPELENHLITGDMSTRVAANTDSAMAEGRVVASGDFRWGSDNLADHADLNQALSIEPGKSYLLKFDFADPDRIHGVLQVSGPHFFREYGLPAHGGKRAFGAGGEHAKAFPVWTTAGPETLEVRFYPETPKPRGEAGPSVGHAELLSYDPAALPVRVESWMPYRAEVQSPVSAWLETPRMFQPGYSAWVDGKPAAVRKSQDLLVAVEVPAGKSSVTLSYVAPAGLRFLFGLSMFSILGATAFGTTRWILHLLRPQSPAKASEAASSA